MAVQTDEEKKKVVVVPGAQPPSSATDGGAGAQGQFEVKNTDQEGDVPFELTDFTDEHRENTRKYLDENIGRAEEAQRRTRANYENMKGMSYQDFLDSGESEAQKEKREKRERNRRRMAALADGLIGLSNILGAAKGATPVQQTSFSKNVRDRQDTEAARRFKEDQQKREIALKQYEQHAKERENARKAAAEADKDLGAAHERKAKMENAWNKADNDILYKQQEMERKTKKDAADKEMAEKKLAEQKRQANQRSADTRRGQNMRSADTRRGQNMRGHGSGHGGGRDRDDRTTYTESWEDDNGVRHSRSRKIKDWDEITFD